MAIYWPYAFTLPKFLQALRILVIPWDRILHPFLHCVICLGKASKKKFFWEISPKCGWVGWPFSTRISPFVLPNLTKTLGWVGKQIWESSTKKTFFLRFPWTILVWTVKNDIGWWWSTFWHSTGSFGSHRIEEVQVKIPANYNEDFDVSSSNVFIPNLLRQRPLFRFGVKRPLYIN